MSQPSIVVDRVSKQYRIGEHQGEGMLRDALVGGVARLLGRRRSEPESVWALRDVSLEVSPDEVVGVIGRNGSGKTTLLKLLARITYPSSGDLRVHGRVASLVEVGTGFHNELTGRENVFLNGSILGLKRREIAKHFDAIHEFSGIGRFIDTPIKRYSTGMRMRLGFAVAAHLFPDVLLVDEVLAVGDVEFQNRCLETLHDVGQRGHTVMFVSHNLEAIESICPRTLWIDRGVIRADGNSREVIASYLKETASVHRAVVDLSTVEHRGGSGEARFSGIEFLDDAGRPTEVVRTGDNLRIRLHYRADQSIKSPYFGIQIATDYGTLVANPNSWTSGLEIPVVEAGDGTVELSIASLDLLPGTYPLTLWMNRHADSESIDYLDHCAVLTVHAPDTATFGRMLDRRAGVVWLDSSWRSVR